MPQLTALTCPVCAAPLQPNTDQCGFCGSYIVIKTDLPRLDRRTLNQSVIQQHIHEFRQRSRTNSFDEEAHYGLGLAYFSLGLIDESVGELTQAARLMPENPHIQAQLAVVLHEAVKAGNRAAEAQMQTRIQSALLLDPTNMDARALKLEVLLDQQAYAEAVSEFQAMPVPAQDKVRPKIVCALEKVCIQRMDAKDWSGARWYWAALAPLDPQIAKRLVLQFLNLHASLVPRTNKVRRSEAGYASPDPDRTDDEPGQSRWVRIGRYLGAAVVGFVIGVVQLLVVGALVPTDETNTTSGWGALLLILSILLLIASPVIGIIMYRKRNTRVVQSLNVSRHKQPRTVFTSVRKADVLAGRVDLDPMFAVVDTVMARLRAADRTKSPFSVSKRK